MSRYDTEEDELCEMLIERNDSEAAHAQRKPKPDISVEARANLLWSHKTKSLRLFWSARAGSAHVYIDGESGSIPVATYDEAKRLAEQRVGDAVERLTARIKAAEAVLGAPSEDA